MDTSMAVSGEKIKALRDARAWSQAHLAEAASLSLRTVQRVEAEGTASAETRLAIAAALGVSVDDAQRAGSRRRARAAARPARRPGAARHAADAVQPGAAVVYLLWMGAGCRRRWRRTSAWPATPTAR